MADSVDKVRALIPSPITTVVICRNQIETVDDPQCDVDIEDIDKSAMFSTYVGDVCPATNMQTFHDSQYIQIQDGYNFLQQRDDEEEWKWFPFYETPTMQSPQALLIAPPIADTFDINYLHKLLSNYKSLDKLLSNNQTLTKDIVSCIFEYLPFTFPIFISCTSIFRGRGDFTHWTYPYTKSKGWMLEYLRKCEQIFDEKEDSFYVSDWFLMKDDAPVDFRNKSDWIDRHSDLLLQFKHDEQSMQRVWNEPTLIARKETKRLDQAIVDRNDVGGSYWLSMQWKKEDADTEWFADRIEAIADGQQFSSRIGGSGGIKSRCYYQTNGSFAGKYLPMSVLSVCCNCKMLQDISSGSI
mmetsp:Transcript_69739/g.110828  ORF Transcript_69739/g.110828 Transcript_69739/m.110828 type:complete len:354 (+) Transcript_69739:33-1094(+)